MKDIILLKKHQHKLILISNFLLSFIKIGVLSSIIFIYIFRGQILLQILSVLIIVILIFFIEYFFWYKSYFIVSNEKILIKVRNGLFSMYHMNIYYKNIRDMAYSKNNIFHYMFDYGTFFARSSAGASGDFEAKYIPNVGEVYKIINGLFLMDDKQRQEVTSINQLLEDKETETEKIIIENEMKKLLSIPGILECVLLNNEDRKFIFSHEEDRNHGVYECLKRKVLFCVTHDEKLRDPDSLIVLKLGNKVIFPAVSFHEIRRPSTVSSSPGLEVHNYLIKKFKKVGEYDATILIGFDL
ncbi:MAG: PH domain-containing protein [Candidatus Gracilibacteria bacterium]|nr:PH domain-containing protein [Candidatus Gracilibacteria bacterium]